MKPILHRISSTFRQRGFWLRCFLVLLPLLAIASIGRTQCVYGSIFVSRIHGGIYDRVGVPIPNVKVVLKADSKLVSSTTTDDAGQFSIPTSQGNYEFNADAEGFAPFSLRIGVGTDLAHLFRRSRTWIILDVGSPDLDRCTGLFTTSRRQFEKAIHKHQNKG